jgi:hypothetical protein
MKGHGMVGRELRHEILIKNLKKRDYFSRSRRRWKANIEMDLKQIESKGLNRILILISDV